MYKIQVIETCFNILPLTVKKIVLISQKLFIVNSILFAWFVLRVSFLSSLHRNVIIDITKRITETALFRAEGKPKSACVLSSFSKSKQVHETCKLERARKNTFITHNNKLPY